MKNLPETREEAERVIDAGLKSVVGVKCSFEQAAAFAALVRLARVGASIAGAREIRFAGDERGQVLQATMSFSAFPTSYDIPYGSTVLVLATAALKPLGDANVRHRTALAKGLSLLDVPRTSPSTQALEGPMTWRAAESSCPKGDRQEGKYVGTYGTLRSAKTQCTILQKKLLAKGENWFAEITERHGVGALASVWHAYLYPGNALKPLRED